MRGQDYLVVLMLRERQCQVIESIGKVKFGKSEGSGVQGEAQLALRFCGLQGWMSLF